MREAATKLLGGVRLQARAGAVQDVEEAVEHLVEASALRAERRLLERFGVQSFDELRARFQSAETTGPKKLIRKARPR